MAGVLASCLLGAAVGFAAEPVRRESIAVVVGSSSGIANVTVDELRELYLRRQRIWQTGEAAVPVDLVKEHPARNAFSQRVLGRAPEDLQTYWSRRRFDGVRPPIALETSHAVCAYVASDASAIGYLPLSDVDATVCRVLLVLSDEADHASLPIPSAPVGTKTNGTS